MIILSAQGVRKSFGGNIVLEDASFVLQQGQRLGLVGVNGSGKSTLMRILAGELEPDAGQISMTKGLRIGYLAQQSHIKDGNTVYQELYDVFQPVIAMEERLHWLEEEMGRNRPDLDSLTREYARLTDAFEEAGGYGYQSQIAGVLAGLGFSKDRYDQPASSLSGGEKTRLCLGKLLLLKPDLLLLDEATNHLDLASVTWLEDYLSTYRGTVLLISHDRYFMDHVCTNMMELLMGRMETYDGNYSAYMKQRAQRYESRIRAYEQQQKMLARERAIIERYQSFNREKSIKAAESRQKRLDKVTLLDKPVEEQSIHFSFDTRRRTGEDVLFITNLSKKFGERQIFSNLNLHVRAGERIALLGSNGIGKSTLLKILMHQEQPDSGEIRYGSNVDVGYYDQHQAGLHDEKTVLDEVWDDFRLLTQTEVRGALGQFLFSGEDVFAPVKTLSGGEKGRVALTKLMLRKDNVLFLDEPTNHLDMESREVLEEALTDYPGTIVAVSHDRYFINRFAQKVLVMKPDGLEEYLGNYDDYQAKINREQPPDNEIAGKTKTALDKEKKRSRAAQLEEKAAKALVKQLENEIGDTEKRIIALEAQLGDPEIYAEPEKARKLSDDYRDAQNLLEELYSRWESASEAL